MRHPMWHHASTSDGRRDWSNRTRKIHRVCGRICRERRGSRGWQCSASQVGLWRHVHFGPRHMWRGCIRIWRGWSHGNGAGRGGCMCGSGGGRRWSVRWARDTRHGTGVSGWCHSLGGKVALWPRMVHRCTVVCCLLLCGRLVHHADFRLLKWERRWAPEHGAHLLWGRVVDAITEDGGRRIISEQAQVSHRSREAPRVR